MCHIIRCNETAADGLYYRGTYCESSASAGGSGLCILYNSCVNVTVEYPEKAEELCQTDTTLYKTARVDAVDVGRYIQSSSCCLRRRSLLKFFPSWIRVKSCLSQTDNEHYCFVRTVQDKTTCTIPYVYEFQEDKTVMLKIAEKVRRSVDL